MIDPLLSIDGNQRVFSGCFVRKVWRYQKGNQKT